MSLGVKVDVKFASMAGDDADGGVLVLLVPGVSDPTPRPYAKLVQGAGLTVQGLFGHEKARAGRAWVGLGELGRAAHCEFGSLLVNPCIQIGNAGATHQSSVISLDVLRIP